MKSKTTARAHYTLEELLCWYSRKRALEIIAAGQHWIAAPKSNRKASR